MGMFIFGKKKDSPESDKRCSNIMAINTSNVWDFYRVN